MKHRMAAGSLLAVCLLTCRAYAEYLPHIANGSFAGGSFRTTFILFNNTDNNDEVGLQLAGDDGSPLVVTIPGLGTGSQFSINLPPGATRIFQTDGAGSLVAGAARVDSYSLIGVSAIFSIYDNAGNFVTEAGVGGCQPLAEFVIPVDVTGDFNTGLALYNPFGDQASVDLVLLDTAGNETARSNLAMGPGTHLARFVGGPGQLFPSVSGFRGMLAIRSSIPLAALTLRQNSAPLSYTSLPVQQCPPVFPWLFLPHVANGSYGGGSFKTSFLLFNPNATPAHVTLSLTKSDGTPFRLTLPGKGTGSEFDIKLDPNASAFLQTDGLGPLAVGAASIISDVPIGACGIFSVFDAQGRFQTEAGVEASVSSGVVTLPVDITGNFDTGVALFTPDPSGIELTLVLFTEDGEPLGASRKLPLPGGNHSAQFVSQLFSGISNFRGSLAISAGGLFSAITLRQNSSPLSYTTLPVRQGISGGRILPLAPQTKAGITATGDVTVDLTLATGFKVTGIINGPGYPELVLAQSSTGEMIEGRIGDSPSGTRYAMVLPAGSYTLKLWYRTQDGCTDVIFTDLSPLEISADTQRDITLAPVSQTDISGIVSGLSSLPPIQFKSIVFNSLDNTLWTQLLIEDDGRYSGKIAPGSYRANLYMNVQFSDDRMQQVTVSKVGDVTIGSSPAVADFTLPPLARLSGTLSWTDATEASIYATDRSAPASGPSITGADTSGQYQMTLVKDRVYDIQVGQHVVRLRDQADYGVVRYPFPSSVVNLSADTRLDISVPDLPGGVVISGRVTDGSGRGIGNVSVNVMSESITGVPGARLGNGDRTDREGYYRIPVLNGTNYTLTFYPPVPAP